MKSLFVRFSMAAVMILIYITFWGCAYPVKPRPTPIEGGLTPELSTSATIYLMNGHSSDDTITLTKFDTGETYEADRQLWTNVIIKVLSNELEKRGATIREDDYSKLLILTIPGANMPALPLTFKVRLNLRIETGDGYVKNFYAVHVGHGFSPDRTADVAISKIVKAVLTDRNIRKYLRDR